MSTKFKNIDRETPMLFPPDLRDWVPADDMVHFVIDAVEGMVLKKFKVNERGTGSAQYPPRMMLSLLIYCYANGIFSSRRIERATYRDVAVRFLTGDSHPDHDTICKFRRENFDLVAECFVGILQLAKELKILKVGTVSTDGTKLKANASKHKNVRYDRSKELIDQLKLDVDTLMKKAETADHSEDNDGQQLPDEIARREKLRKKLEAARAKLEKQAKAKAESERENYEEKVRKREQRKGSRKGKKIKPPKEEPEPSNQINLVDSDSRLMRKNKRSAYEQGYNAQATVDAEGSQLILGARVSQCASDRGELLKNIHSIPECIGKPQNALADNGYLDKKQIKELENEKINVYVSTGAEAARNHRKYDFRPPGSRSERRKSPRSDWIIEMKEKLETDEGRRKYKLRKQTVEPVFGIIKHVLGFRQFMLRGLEKISGEWDLLTLSYNMKRLWKLQSA